MALNNFFLLQLPPFIAIALISLALTFVLTILFKYTTNQRRMKEIKDQQKKLQQEYKKNASDPKKAMKVNQKLMSINFEYMKHSFKSTLYTFIPLILIFAWMNAIFGYEQIYPDQKFTVTATFEKLATGSISLNVSEGLTLLSNATMPVAEEVQWIVKGKEGTQVLTYIYGDETYQQEVLITNQWKFNNPVLNKNKGFLGTGNQLSIAKTSQLKEIKVNLLSTKPLAGVPILGGLNWLWTYILLSIGGSILFRKLMNVY